MYVYFVLITLFTPFFGFGNNYGERGPFRQLVKHFNRAFIGGGATQNGRQFRRKIKKGNLKILCDSLADGLTELTVDDGLFLCV